MKLFISGSKSISVLSDEVKSILDEHITMGTEFLVGDCYGVDAAVQKYLVLKGYRNVTIYCSGETPRNNFATGAKVHSCAEAAKGLTGSAFHYVKDIQMANDCNQAIMIWDGKSKGTGENILRIKEMKKPYRIICSVSPKKGDSIMPKYIIMDSSAGECEGALYADIKLKDENGKIIYFTLIETDGKPILYKTNMRITHLVTEPDYDPEQLEIVNATKVVYKGENYNALFDNSHSFAPFAAIRCVIHLVHTFPNCIIFSQELDGKCIDEIDIPKSDVEIAWEKNKAK